MLHSRTLCLLAVAAALCRAQTPVILISIDTLRADRVGASTPNILSYSQNGTVFTAAETQIPFTLPSHTALLTSTYPFRNGVEENADRVPQNLPTLASVLRGRGYQTAAFIGSIFLERQLGLDRGFDDYDSPFSFGAFSKLSGSMLFAGGPHNTYSVRERRQGALVLRAANQWLAAHKGQPVFAFIHLFDVHKPYRLGSYNAEVQNVDRLLGGFRETLKREGWWDRALIAIVADHGEGLGEHGESDHGYFVYESTLHVPLIVHWPAGAQPLPARVNEPVGLIDVAPTILDFLKIPKPASFEGRGVLDRSPRTVISESTYGRDCFGWAPLRSVRMGPLKYIDAPKPEIYDLDKDPQELNNLFKSRPADAARLKAQLGPVFSPPRAAPSGDPARNKRVLESLGYLAPGPQAISGKAASDPKDKLPELLRYEDALDMMEDRQYDGAIATLHSILGADPNNLLARRDLGVAFIEKHEYAKAVEELQRVAAASGDDYVTRYELGVAHEGLGQFRAAQDQYEFACRIAPGAQQCKDAIERVRGK
ncbi:MAG: sulfatase-like hydrolase/transferase [Acidobacteriota bacterium]|nr:sulfatase-like hydrolase/transferase [Acidobacteriota bacterium]